jgi:monoamine oxidase
MKSITRNFKNIKEKHPEWGSYIVLAETVYGNNFSQDRLARAFKTLIDKGEYLKEEKKELLAYLYELNKPLNRTKNDGKTPQKGLLKSKVDERCLYRVKVIDYKNNY